MTDEASRFHDLCALGDGRGPEVEARAFATASTGALVWALRGDAAERLDALVRWGVGDRLARLVEVANPHADYAVLADLALVLGRSDLSRALLAAGTPNRVPVLAGWHEARVCLHDGVVYADPGALKVRGVQKTWLPYLPLAAAISRGAPFDAELAAVDAAIATRNTDRRLLDHTLVHGDGRMPTTWDLRRRVLLSFAAPSGQPRRAIGRS